MIEKADILWQDSDIDARIRLQEALFPDGLMYDSVAGTVYAPDSYKIQRPSVHWIYTGVKQGAKKLVPEAGASWMRI